MGGSWRSVLATTGQPEEFNWHETTKEKQDRQACSDCDTGKGSCAILLPPPQRLLLRCA